LRNKKKGNLEESFVYAFFECSLRGNAWGLGEKNGVDDGKRGFVSREKTGKRSKASETEKPNEKDCLPSFHCGEETI